MSSVNNLPDNSIDRLVVDVLIIGGGPCGLMLATELGRRGIHCLLVDMKPGTAFNPQANATQARTMEHFRRHGFADQVRQRGLPADHPTDIAYFTRYADYELARLRLPTAAEAVENIKHMSGSWSAAELPHRVSQKFVEEILREQAESYESNDIRFGWEALDFTDTGSEVVTSIAQVGSGKPIEVVSRFLVGADGPRSFVRHKLGIAWEGETGIKRDFMGGKMFAIYFKAPEFYEKFPHDRAWMYVAVNSKRRAFMASVDGNSEFAIHAAIHEGEDPDQWTDVDSQKIINEVMGTELPIEVLSKGAWLAGHALFAQQFQQGRIFIGGDAAHLFTPTGGLGYNTAVEDAVNLGWKLASVIQGAAPDSLLDSYELERKPIAKRNTGYARKFADSVGLFKATELLDEESEAGEAEREKASEHLNAHVRMEFNIPGVTFGGRYDNSPIIIGDGSSPPEDSINHYQPTACPGGRPPHMWLSEDESLYDTFNFDWTLLCLGQNELSASSFIEEAKSLGLDLKVVRNQSDELYALYEKPLVLIRPDQIVAWRGDDAENALTVLRMATGALDKVKGDSKN